ncbi:hypothetical protein BX616_009666 [Lobosporangium transversale]|uniref:Uncharacterized protein n=1 Tax=Lobosporangium transversale TaxID=64571 RepID=A0A1Y2H2L8_9FUNG|nr:hypothetical protein BCR41DRAFT_382755 [Lobosporangium transversale]KAF9918274.1 hypothetical protein BX616_009666 [Lobosporangium transversale]ORZ28810.1 hypothetical protein BCR41DRAFT_382755 [Lobosporangium transversale]|eukprot:XP_021886483.1 hypothetical protein BCR41DRAFT_382755 [Lobosporangium transversale]
MHDYHSTYPAYPTSLHQTMYLQQFLQSQEAAKCFDDDLDFCPSLTAKEVAEMKLESALANSKSGIGWRQQNHARGPSLSLPTSPLLLSSPSHSSRTAITNGPPPSPLPSSAPQHIPTVSKAVAIVDPTSKTAVQLPSSVNANIGASTKPRQGSVSSVSSMDSTHSSGIAGSYTGSDMSIMAAMDPSLSSEAREAVMLDWSFQQQQMYHMHEMQQQQQPYLFDDMMFNPVEPSLHLNGQREMVVNPSMGMYSAVPHMNMSSIGMVPDYNMSTAMPGWYQQQQKQQRFVSVR